MPDCSVSLFSSSDLLKCVWLQAKQAVLPSPQCPPDPLIPSSSTPLSTEEEALTYLKVMLNILLIACLLDWKRRITEKWHCSRLRTRRKVSKRLDPTGWKRRSMGNCLFSQGGDDLSLLNDSEGGSLPGEPPPPYQVSRPGVNFSAARGFMPLQWFYDWMFFVICVFKQHTPPGPVFHPTPGESRSASQLTEEEQIRIAQRIGLIQHLPKGVFNPGSDPSEKKVKECVICMMDFEYGDPIRFLPCLHIYHLDCIDSWLMRSFTCPSCMEPVDAALLSSYETN
ncbi:RING finger protein 11 [Xenoophorus captivus]|uniref:RING finger protein 11 n=1 Tax=Xenoophorus captivus TaxID=1517983 RepID=A0ABV0S376_9TELE